MRSLQWVVPILILSLGVNPASPQSAPVLSAGTFVTRLGVDTIAVERFQRTTHLLEGEIVWRSPAFGAARYAIDLDSTGAPVTFRVTNITPQSARRPPYTYRSASGRVTRDSAYIEVTGDSTLRQTRPASNALLVPPYSWAAREVAIARLRTAGIDSARVPILSIGDRGASIGTMALRLHGADSLRVWNALAVGPLHGRADAQGRILSADGYATTSRYVVERVNQPADFPAIVRAFAIAETSGREFGSVIATRDTVRATVGTVRIEIDYGRPKVRGRRVFTGGVLGDTLWRTGANAATALRTSGDLLLGGQLIPAGAYTLYTAISPDNSRYALVVNKQVGQWGTSYDVARDLVRIPMRAGAAPPTEQFTIRVEPSPSASAGALRLVWDRTELAVDLRPARDVRRVVPRALIVARAPRRLATSFRGACAPAA